VTARTGSLLVRFTLALLLVIVLVPHVAGGAVPGDIDGDGFAPPADCDDARAEINPLAIEVPANRTDENCDGFLADADGDGYDAPADCDDSEPNVHPGATEYPRNRTDENCDGLLADADGDGYDAPADCDDSEPNVHPGATEYPRNVIDENCDGRLADADGDGYDTPADCDDSQPTVHPSGRELPNNQIDEDCDGFPPWPRAKVGATLKSQTMKSGVTRLLALQLTGIRAGDLLQVYCWRRGCRGRIDYRALVSSNHAKLNLSSSVRNKRLAPGIPLRVRVRRRDHAASVFTFTMPRAAGQRPSRVLRCQWPNENALRPC
jgi:hypothetical protein